MILFLVIVEEIVKHFYVEWKWLASLLAKDFSVSTKDLPHNNSLLETLLFFCYLSIVIIKTTINNHNERDPDARIYTATSHTTTVVFSDV